MRRALAQGQGHTVKGRRRLKMAVKGPGEEYIAAGVGEERPGAMAAWMAYMLGRSRQKWPAALVVELLKPSSLEIPPTSAKK
eukprot:Skav219229  [mRNA]  locus=scaffold2965:159349:167809:- [translate_table: standard]